MRSDSIRGWLLPAFLVLCLLLGGASGPRTGIIANATLQAMAVILILFSLWTRSKAPYPREAKPLLLIGVLWLLLAVIYLVPLPYGIWTTLPGREPIASGFKMLGVQDAEIPITLSPEETISSILRLLPPAAIFLLTVQLSQRQRRRIPAVVLGVAVISIALGVAQLAGGLNSPLRFYRITNPDMPVGFFANGNHQATLLLCAIAFSGYALARAASKGSSPGQRSGGVIFSISILLFLLIGLAMVTSLAGYGLLLPTLAATALVYRRSKTGRLTKPWIGGIAAIFLVTVTLAVAGPFGDQDLGDQLSEHPTSRKVIGATTLTAIEAFFPVGSGLGSFADVYRTFDDPYRPVTEYVNRAHNDYLEVALETGLVGILLMIAFIIWWGIQTKRVWPSDLEGANLARAATIVIGLVLLHSLVDYPMRTSAIAAIVAVSCALLLPARASQKRGKRREEASKLRHIEAD